MNNFNRLIDRKSIESVLLISYNDWENKGPEIIHHNENKRAIHLKGISDIEKIKINWSIIN